MKFMIVNTDYEPFIRQLYQRHSGLASASYAEQHRARMDSLFGTADFFSRHLRRLGHEAWDVNVNVEPMQRQWLREHGGVSTPGRAWQLKLRRGCIPWPTCVESRDWVYDILAEQVRSYQPDVLYCLALETIGSDFLRRVRGYYGIAVGQHAAPLPQHDIQRYDMILSSLPNQVEHFRRMGLRSEHLHLGFEPAVLRRLIDRPKRYDIAFVGGLVGPHSRGIDALEALARQYSVKVWGYGAEQLPVGSVLRQTCEGPIFGRDMYQALRDARLVFNRHIDQAGPYANNFRLYEATGVGSCLLTDAKDNLHELFTPGREVLTYRDADECVELAGYYLRCDQERESIALAGQRRTLTDHTFADRVERMTKLVARDVNRIARAA